MIPFLIAGGTIITSLVIPEAQDLINHTLAGEKVRAKEVVCRNAWGTPMLPDGKGSYSLISPINPIFIERSLIQPPKTEAPTYVPGKPYVLPSMVNAAAEPAKETPTIEKR